MGGGGGGIEGPRETLLLREALRQLRAPLGESSRAIEAGEWPGQARRRAESSPRSVRRAIMGKISKGAPRVEPPLSHAHGREPRAESRTPRDKAALSTLSRLPRNILLRRSQHCVSARGDPDIHQRRAEELSAGLHSIVKVNFKQTFKIHTRCIFGQLVWRK